jgi:probable rRNA maturation factor
MSVVCDVLLDDPRWRERLDVEALVNAAVQKAIEVTGVALHEAAEASFTFADDDRVQQLNEQWRQKAAPTNVLSFSASNGVALDKAPLLGDVVLAYETIEREAADEGKPFSHHTAHMIVHGFLHLIGYDHQSDTEAAAMEGIESTVLLGLGIPDPWADDMLAGEV